MSRYDEYLSAESPAGHEEKIKKAARSALQENRSINRRKLFSTWFLPLAATAASLGAFLFEFQRQRREQQITPGIDLALIDIPTDDLLSMTESEISLVEDIDILENWDVLVEEENG